MKAKKMYRKVALASMIAVAGTAVAMSAQAGDFAGTGTGFNENYAVELFGTGSDATEITTAETLVATYTMATAPGTGAAFIITFSLSNGATWGTTLDGTNLAYTASDTGALTKSVVDGGAVTDSTVKYRIDVTTAMAATDTFALTFHTQTASALGTVDAEVEISIDIDDTLSAPVDTAETIVIATGKQGTTTEVEASTSSANLFIDVTAESKLFVADDYDDDGLVGDVTAPESAEDGQGVDVNLGNVEFTDVSSEIYEDDGTTSWTIGTEDATNAATFTLSNAIWPTDDSWTVCLTESASCTSSSLGDFALTATGGTLVVDDITDGTYNVVMVVDGVTAIEQQTASLQVEVDYDDATYVDVDESGTLRALVKNGSSDRSTFLLAPNGAYENFVKVLNPSTVDGNVFVQVWNGDGDEANFELGDIEGVDSTILVAGASTGMINVNAIGDAAAVANTDDDFTGQLRMQVNAEFGKTGYDTGVVMNSFNLSKDGNSFTMMNDSTKRNAVSTNINDLD